MSNTSNLVIAFIGGTAVGGLATAGVMKKMGYVKLIDGMELPESRDAKKETDIHPEKDKPSFDPKGHVDTHKTSYSSIFDKPDLEEVSKRYQNEDFDKEMAEREHPEEDISEESDEEEYEIGDAMSHHFSPDDLEMEEIDGFGHVICELSAKRRDVLVYLVHEDYSGEIYPVEDLTYYEKDNVLCDVNMAAVSDIINLVGDALECFGRCGSDDNKVYVRNCSMGLEYEITRVNSYYAAKVYGIKDEDFEGGSMAQIPRKAQKKHKKATEEDEE